MAAAEMMGNMARPMLFVMSIGMLDFFSTNINENPLVHELIT